MTGLAGEPLAAFVRRRRPEWDELGGLVRERASRTLSLAEVERVDRLYRRATSDLAHAQALYAGADVTLFLNQLCAQAYATLYRPPPARFAQVAHFFRRELPRTLRESGRYVAVSALLLVAGAVLGALVLWLEPAAGEALLIPPGVRAAVASHRIWTDNLLSVTPPSVVASQIATNNLTVLITTYALGLTLGLGTVAVLLMNGLSLGAVFVYCIRGGLGAALGTFILGHGPVELSTIIIGGGAGLMVGDAIIRGGELPRREQLRIAGRRGALLVVGCMPFLGAIALVEGFVSPGGLFNQQIKAALGAALGIAFWAYLLGAGRRGSPSDNAATTR